MKDRMETANYGEVNSIKKTSLEGDGEGRL